MKNNSMLYDFFRFTSIAGNFIFVLWILYNGINEGFQGTIYEIISYIGLLGLLLTNAILLFRSVEMK